MDDLISRQDAINEIDSLYFDTVDDHDRTKERIERMPAAQSEQDEYTKGYIAGANWAVREIAQKICESLDDEFIKYMNPPVEE